jgi:Kef-type K+ transport system membrane component KefB
MGEHDLMHMFFGLSLLLGIARVLGDFARRYRYPALLGEIAAGVMLGPTLLGKVDFFSLSTLFPSRGPLTHFYQGFNAVAVVLFLFVAGMEISLSKFLKNKKVSASVSIFGILVPFSLGWLAAWMYPQAMGYEAGTHEGIFRYFLATAMSISALPVIARILMDLKIYRTSMGTVAISAAIIDDLLGWMIFSMVLGAAGKSDQTLSSLSLMIGLMLVFVGITLTMGRIAINRVFPLLAHSPEKMVTFCISITLLCAAVTEWIGVHSLFGALIAGVAFGDSEHLGAKVRGNVEDFISSFFAPLFFAGIGLKVDFLLHFDALLFGSIFLIACLGKILGCGFAAKWAGMTSRESFGVGMIMNARGAMEIILGLLALQYGLIGERLFVALVLVALATSLMAGPAVLAVFPNRGHTHPHEI